MITRISGVIRPKGSDLIFDHPYNGDDARLARPNADHGVKPNLLRADPRRESLAETLPGEAALAALCLIQVSLVSVILGEGIPWLAGTRGPVRLSDPEVVEDRGVTHLRYVVRK
jgi:hypothetical protein